MRKLVLWGHHVAEYKAMFDVSDDALCSRVLEYGCGPSAINATLHEKSAHLVSVDPLFRLEKPALTEKIQSLSHHRIEQMRTDKHPLDVASYGGVDAFIASRQEGIATFLADYEKGREEKRYQALPKEQLLFTDAAFDYALSSHYLFADPDSQPVDFHLQVISELARVANEVRIFPLIDRTGQPSPLLGPVLLGLQQENFGVEVREVNYTLYPAGNAMLRVWAQQCHV